MSTSGEGAVATSVWSIHLRGDAADEHDLPGRDPSAGKPEPSMAGWVEPVDAMTSAGTWLRIQACASAGTTRRAPARPQGLAATMSIGRPRSNACCLEVEADRRVSPRRGGMEVRTGHYVGLVLARPISWSARPARDRAASGYCPHIAACPPADRDGPRPARLRPPSYDAIIRGPACRAMMKSGPGGTRTSACWASADIARLTWRSGIFLVPCAVASRCCPTAPRRQFRVSVGVPAPRNPADRPAWSAD